MNNKHEEEKFQFQTLYDTVSRIYSVKTPISRILYIASLKDSDKGNKDHILSNVREEIKRSLNKTGNKFNLMMVLVGTANVLVAIENSNDNIMSYLSQLHLEIKSGQSLHSTVNIITYVEECPNSVFPVWYKYEMTSYGKESQLYKDKPATEKAWVMYNNLFCNMGSALKAYINTEDDFILKEALIRKEENAYAKYFPSADEIKEFSGNDFISLESFVRMYIDMVDVELDEDLVWPYNWPINV